MNAPAPSSKKNPRIDAGSDRHGWGGIRFHGSAAPLCRQKTFPRPSAILDEKGRSKLRGLSAATETPVVDIEIIRTAAARIVIIAMKNPAVCCFCRLLPRLWLPSGDRLKAESLQPIGAFKIRGAANKILQLTPEEIARGVITYSSGNHAQAVAYAAREVGAKAVIVMPSNAPAIKRAATLALGAESCGCGRGLQRAAGHGRETGARARLRGHSAI